MDHKISMRAHNEETREGRENLGEVEVMEIDGRAFSYIVREAMDFKMLFNYLNSVGNWEESTN